MAKRPTQTIILITRERLLRADFERGQLIDTWEQPNQAELDDAALQVEVGLGLGPRPGRVVWVLSSEVWTQQVGVKGGGVASLAHEELAQALAFEAEALSGIGVIESALAHRLVQRRGGQHIYWITQSRIDEIERIAQVVRGAGSSFGGLCHVGGLPVPLVCDAKAPWERVELWPGTIVCVHAGAGKAPQFLIINASPQEQRWRADKEQWEKAVGAARQHEILMADGEVLRYEQGAAPELALERPPALRVWLAGWARRLESKNPDVPVLRAVRAATAPSTRTLVAMALLLLAVGLCAAHHLYLRRVAMPPMEAELARLTSEAQQLKAMQTQKTAGEKERGELGKAIREMSGKIVGCEMSLLAHRRRLATLLASLAEDSPQDLFVRKIERDKDVPLVHGFALRSELANDYAARLSGKLRAFGWQAQVREQAFAAERGLYVFAIALEEVTVTPAPSQALQAVMREVAP